MHPLVCIPSGDYHCPCVALRKARHLSLGTWGRHHPVWLELAVSLVLADHYTSSSLGYSSQSQYRQLLTLGQTSEWAFLTYHYNTFSKIEHLFSDPVFWSISYVTAHMPKYCVTASQIICKTVLAASLLSDNLFVYLGISGCHKYSILESLTNHLSPTFFRFDFTPECNKTHLRYKIPAWQKLPHEAEGH